MLDDPAFHGVPTPPLDPTTLPVADIRVDPLCPACGFSQPRPPIRDHVAVPVVLTCSNTDCRTRFRAAYRLSVHLALLAQAAQRSA